MERSFGLRRRMEVDDVMLFGGELKDIIFVYICILAVVLLFLHIISYHTIQYNQSYSVYNIPITSLNHNTHINITPLDPIKHSPHNNRPTDQPINKTHPQKKSCPQ